MEFRSARSTMMRLTATFSASIPNRTPFSVCQASMKRMSVYSKRVLDHLKMLRTWRRYNGGGARRLGSGKTQAEVQFTVRILQLAFSQCVIVTQALHFIFQHQL